MMFYASGGPLLFTDKWFKFKEIAAKSLQKKNCSYVHR